MQQITNCRACSSGELEFFLDLGETPLANSLVSFEQQSNPEFVEVRAPLGLLFCRECAVVQVTHTVPPTQIFSQYAYFSSYSDTILAHSEATVARLIQQRNLNSSSMVVEVGSNDGYLLQYYKNKNIPCLGVEPAVNVAAVAQQKGIDTLCEFFDDEVATSLVGRGMISDNMNVRLTASCSTTPKISVQALIIWAKDRLIWK